MAQPGAGRQDAAKIVATDSSRAGTGWSASTLSDEFSGAANALRNQVLIAALWRRGLLGVVWFMVRGVVVRPLAVAAKAADDVAKGNVHGGTQGRGDNGALLGAMRGMQSMVRHFSEAQEEMSRHHADGRISFRMQAGGSVAHTDGWQTNDLVHAHIEVSNRIVDAAGVYARGDFAVKLEALPGEKARFTQAVEAVRTSLESAAEAATINASGTRSTTPAPQRASRMSMAGSST